MNNIQRDFLDNPKKMRDSTKRLAKRYGVSEQDIINNRNFVKDVQKGFNKVQNPIVNNQIKNDPNYEIDIIKRQCSSELKVVQEKYKSLLDKYQDIERKFNDSLRLGDFPNILTIPKFPQYKREGASIIIWSDWHLGKVIEKSSVNGVNEYNPEIAKRRSLKCADSTIKLINKDSGEFDNHHTVIFLLGDFIEGYIHPEGQRVMNSMTPIEEVVYAQELLYNGIKNILENSNTDKVTVVCRTGNHGRNTKRMESSIDHRTNYESMLYAFLASKFKDEVDFILPLSDIGYTEILGKTVRDFHGHQIQYGGGIGGLTIPLTKFIYRQNQNRRADYNLLGNFHQLSLPTPDSMLSGSLCGFDNYAQSIGAVKEPPLQAYRLLDSKYGFTGFNPIICE